MENTLSALQQTRAKATQTTPSAADSSSVCSSPASVPGVTVDSVGSSRQIASAYTVPSPRSQMCDLCQMSSPLVFRRGWACLRSACPAFWDFSGDTQGSPTYDDGFLQLRPDPGFIGFSWDLTPKRPIAGKGRVVTTSRLYARGWWCERCGRLCSR